MALSIFARIGRAVKRAIGLHMIEAQGAVTLQEIHRVIAEVKDLKYEIQVFGDDARTARIHAAGLHDGLFNQVTNAYAIILDVQTELRDIKYKIGNEAGTKDQGYRIMDHVDALQFAIEELKSGVNATQDIVERIDTDTLRFAIDELKSGVNEMQETLERIDTDPVGRVAAALAEAAQNLEVR